MTSKTVVLQAEAYEFLRKEKKPGETFSDVVLRLKGASKPLSSFSGAWKEMGEGDIATIRGAIRSGRGQDQKRLVRLLRSPRR